MSISKDDTAHIAKLARLALSPEEVEILTTDLGAILGYIEKIAAIEGDGDGAPGTGAAGSPGAAADTTAGAETAPRGTPLRDDVVRPSLPVAEALRPSADHDDDFFRVPPVLSREEGA
jgi:aspartyl-tRNA(Asn)/glutamyl-tRNA(Gln) amidotransferase subunit C